MTILQLIREKKELFKKSILGTWKKNKHAVDLRGCLLLKS